MTAAAALSYRRRFELLVFDWDGTLVDSTGIIAMAIQQACCDLGLPAPADVAARFVIGLGLADALRQVAPTLSPDDYPRLTERYLEHFLACDADIPIFSCAHEVPAEHAALG